MKTNIRIKLGLVLMVTMILGLSTVAYAVDAEAPPSIDFEQPPALEGDAVVDEDAPPSIEIVIPDEGDADPDPDPDQPPGDGGDTAIKITKVSVSPAKFNPMIDETRISFSISKKAKLEVKILDKAGQTVATLLDNQTLNAGNHNVNWFGTRNNARGGQTVKPEVYTYKITAKNANTSVTEDTEQGEVEVIGGGIMAPERPQSGNDSPDQDKATVALNNNKSGTTIGTGPGILIYPLIPALAYLVRRRFKK